MTQAGASDAYIALGANLGDRRENLHAGVRWLTADGGIRCCARSALYETPPVGGPPNQGDYLNAAIRVRTALGPHALLQRCLAAEAELGRERSTANAPRPLDLDLLFYADLVLHEADLTVPHPRMHQRRFVLAPLADIASDVVHPVLHRRVNDLLAALPDDGGVRRVADCNW